MSHYFVASIGPVQDFIASARRSRDLWYGSWMLSELSKAAAFALTEQPQFSQLIFPALTSDLDLLPESPLNVANKIVAIIHDRPTEVGAALQEALHQRLYALRDNAFKEIGSPHSGFRMDVAQEQCNDLIEFYWAAAKFDDETAYAAARKQAEAILAARKGTRNFAQAKGASVPKSSLDGMRESVIPEVAYPTYEDSPEQTNRKISELYRRYGARRGERLSGVDLVKRLGTLNDSRTEKFESTSNIAAKPFLAMVERVNGAGGARKLQNSIVKVLKEEEIRINPEDRGGALLYESRLREWVADEEVLAKITSNLEQIFTEEQIGTKRPDPYYALLLADGDSMGAAIDEQNNPQNHQELSRALSGFATEVVNIVNTHEGNLIYTGGDDILAYLPLHQALKCVNALADKFAETMQTFPAGVTSTKEDRRPTLSGGLVIAHHLDPLADTLALARSSEKRAKSVVDKDALAITINKRSGTTRMIVDKRARLITRLQTMIDLQRNSDISAGVAYELQALGFVLEEQQTGKNNTNAMADEAIRIVARKRKSNSDMPLAESTKTQFRDWIKEEKIPIHELAQELILAGMLANAYDLAYGTNKQEEVAV